MVFLKLKKIIKQIPTRWKVLYSTQATITGLLMYQRWSMIDNSKTKNEKKSGNSTSVQYKGTDSFEEYNRRRETAWKNENIG